MGTTVEVVPAAGRWSEVRTLFGRAGASNGCWCQYWLIGSEYHRRDRDTNRAALHAQVDAASAGLVALSGDEPVGWARLTPRSGLAYLTGRFTTYEFSEDEPLSLPCFYIARRARSAGVMTALIEGAMAEARRVDASLEAYPIDPTATGATTNRFSGVLPAFMALGFAEVGRLSRDRAVVRWR
ncbi:GNAT family N-acetyltransferase [Leifsonia shinshuensis]|uniref:GNAT family N-acetyltransferase n=1 Tax=Leifsonia shinshuensis TaxID=150026 RepID=UPI0028576217|nr:GNAT family N-acetyltransferase [Leifsonia shinshuensis]MDR6971608.1 GNAT superfamily N-acetyltransferase [Leifsonia shinshuensis]